MHSDTVQYKFWSVQNETLHACKHKCVVSARVVKYAVWFSHKSSDLYEKQAS